MNDKPEGLQLTAGDGVIDAACRPVQGAQEYRWYISVFNPAGTNLPMQMAEVTNIPSCQYKGLSNGRKYYCAVSAVDAQGEGPKSDVVDVTPQVQTQSAQPAPSAQPTQGASQPQPVGPPPPVVVPSQGGQPAQANQNAPQAGTRAATAAPPPGAPLQKLRTPQNFRAIEGDREIEFHWDDVRDADRYLIVRYDSKNNRTIFDTVDTVFTDRNVLNGETYKYNLVAKASQNSGRQDSDPARISGTPRPAPTSSAHSQQQASTRQLQPVQVSQAQQQPAAGAPQGASSNAGAQIPQGTSSPKAWVIIAIVILAIILPILYFLRPANIRELTSSGYGQEEVALLKQEVNELKQKQVQGPSLPPIAVANSGGGHVTVVGVGTTNLSWHATPQNKGAGGRSSDTAATKGIELDQWVWFDLKKGEWSPMAEPATGTGVEWSVQNRNSRLMTEINGVRYEQSPKGSSEWMPLPDEAKQDIETIRVKYLDSDGRIGFKFYRE